MNKVIGENKMKLSLEKTWKYCLAMWKDFKDYDFYNLTEVEIEKLRELWLKAHGYNAKSIQHYCFFCQYDKEFKF